jgi:hypothetical protein
MKNKTVTAARAHDVGVPPQRRRSALAAALAGSLIIAGQGWAAAETAAPYQTMRPMTAVELHRLYRDRTWQWTDGAGLCQDQGRIFKAWSGSGADASWAEGRWIVTNSGRLCLKAKWHGKAGAASSSTCFSHRTDGRTIYQKKEPSGDWYVFKHAEPQPGDEFTKLVREDLVSTKLEALRTSPPQPDSDQPSIAVRSLNGETTGNIE